MLTTTYHLGTKLHWNSLWKLTIISQKTKTVRKSKKLAFILSLSSSIPAKLPKKVKDIVKYFKKINNPKEKEIAKKLYAQISLSSNIIREALKIKEAFPNF